MTKKGFTRQAHGDSPISLKAKINFEGKKWRNDMEYNDTKHNDTQHVRLTFDTKHN